MIYGALIRTYDAHGDWTQEMKLYETYQTDQAFNTPKYISKALKENQDLIHCQRLDMSVHFVGEKINDFGYASWCDAFIDNLCYSFQIRRELLISSNRRRKYCDARFICYYVIRENTPLSLQSIGAMFSGRDHSTIIHGIRKCIELSETDHDFHDKLTKAKTIFFELKKLSNV